MATKREFVEGRACETPTFAAKVTPAGLHLTNNETHVGMVLSIEQAIELEDVLDYVTNYNYTRDE